MSLEKEVGVVQLVYESESDVWCYGFEGGFVLTSSAQDVSKCI